MFVFFLFIFCLMALIVDIAALGNRRQKDTTRIEQIGNAAFNIKSADGGLAINAINRRMNAIDH